METQGMISSLHGSLLKKSPTELVIDVHGVGYQVHIPLSTFEKLEHAAGDVTILTYLHVREDTLQLFGFATEAERDMFRLLLSVSGIGPRMAQGILSGLSTQELRLAIGEGNIAALTTISGVGKKTAERIILELRDKLLKSEQFESTLLPTSKQYKKQAEAVIALMSLGYSRQSAEQAVRVVTSESTESDIAVEELIKRALHHTAR